MENQIIIRELQATDDYSIVKVLILEYVQWLGVEGGPEVKAILSSQNFEQELNTLSLTYGFPDGVLFIASVNDKAVAVAGIKRFNEKECEVKRMFVRADSRGLGIGKMLLENCILAAKKLKYETIKLDTAGFMKSAVKLYIQNGFVEIPAYRHNTHEEAKYFELDLKKNKNKQASD